MTRILGLDPGLRHTGWGIIEQKSNRLFYLAHGVISSHSDLTLSQRLQQLFSSLEEVIQNYKPQEAAVEETFVNKNPRSTLKLGMARGVVLLAPSYYNLPVFEYSANQVKKAVVGAGHAEKDQVALMVSRLLDACEKVSHDGADALAIAICHANSRNFTKFLINN